MRSGGKSQPNERRPNKRPETRELWIRANTDRGKYQSLRMLAGILPAVVLGVLVIGANTIALPAPVPSEMHIASAPDLEAEFTMFTGWTNYLQIFSMNVTVNQKVTANLTGEIFDTPPHYIWTNWGGGYSDRCTDGVYIRVETITPGQEYELIGIGSMGGAQPKFAGYVQIRDPEWKISQIRRSVNTPEVMTSIDVQNGRIEFSASWGNSPALPDAAACDFAVILSKGSAVQPFDVARCVINAQYAYKDCAVYQFSGEYYNASLSSNVWRYDMSTRSWNLFSAECPKVVNGAAYVKDDGIILSCGSTPSGESGDTHELVNGTWNTWTSSGPSPRCDVAYAQTDTCKGLLYGGRKYYNPFPETWEIDLKNRTWLQVSTGYPRPVATCRSSMCYDTQTRSYILFGGYAMTGEQMSNSLWVFNGSTWRQINATGAPEPREGAAIVSTPTGIYLFGGFTVTPEGFGLYFNDTWKFDMAGEEWIKLAPPSSPPRQAYGHLYMINPDTLMLVGGWKYRAASGEIYFYSISANKWFSESEYFMIRVSTHLDNYFPGDEVVIYCNRTPPSPATNVTFEVRDPMNVTILIYTVPTVNGNATLSFKLDTNATLGTWSCIASTPTQSARCTFRVIPRVEEIRILSMVYESNVTAGTNFVLTIEVSSNFTVTKDVVLVIQIMNQNNVPLPPGIHNLTLSPISTKMATISYLIPATAQVGLYKFQIQVLSGLPAAGGYALDYKNGTFNVVR